MISFGPPNHSPWPPIQGAAVRTHEHQRVIALHRRPAAASYATATAAISVWLAAANHQSFQAQIGILPAEYELSLMISST
jgi:hypothetical protein